MDTHDRKLDEKGNPLGQHPVGTGVGAVAGGIAGGAAAGTVAAGPVGTAVGAAAGAVAGGLAGKGVAEAAEPEYQDAYWSDRFSDRPYVKPGHTFDQYAPAYRFGVACVRRYEGKSFDDAEAEMRNEWLAQRGDSRLDWNDAKHPVRDAWDWVKRHIDHD